MNNNRPFFFETGTSNLTSTFVRKWVAYIFYKSRVRGPSISNVILHCYSFFNSLRHRLSKDGLMSEETGGFLHIQNEYSKSLSWAENLNIPCKSVNNLFKFSDQDSDLKHLFWRGKNLPVKLFMDGLQVDFSLFFGTFTSGTDMCVIEKDLDERTWLLLELAI